MIVSYRHKGLELYATKGDRSKLQQHHVEKIKTILTRLDAAKTAQTITFTVPNHTYGDAPFAGVAVYAWHCDAQGRYSMYSEGTEDESWLRGVQVADADGAVTFTSIMPGCYAGRWPHIHFEVYPDIDAITDAANAIATSQLAFPADVLSTVSPFLRPILPMTTFPPTTLSLLRSSHTIQHCLALGASEMEHIREPDLEWFTSRAGPVRDAGAGLFGIWADGQTDGWVGREGPMIQACLGGERGGRVKAIKGVPHAFCLCERA